MWRDAPGIYQSRTEYLNTLRTTIPKIAAAIRYTGDASGWYSSRRLAESASAFNVLIEKRSGRILGAQLLGPQAEEVTNLFALAIRAGLTAPQLWDVLYAYPTHGYDIRYTLEVAG